MKQLEINSDKWTFITVCILLGFVLLEAILSLIHLVLGTVPAPPRNRTWVDYMVFIIFLSIFWGTVRDAGFRRMYPYGTAASVLFIIDLGLKLLTRGDAPITASRLLASLELFSCALAIVEVARWFRVKTKLV